MMSGPLKCLPLFKPQNVSTECQTRNALDYDKPEIECPNYKALLQNRRGNDIHNRVIITTAEDRIRVSDDCSLLVPCCDLRNRGRGKACGVIDSTLKNGIVMDGRDREAEGRRGKRHGRPSKYPRVGRCHRGASFRFVASMVGEARSDYAEGRGYQEQSWSQGLRVAMAIAMAMAMSFMVQGQGRARAVNRGCCSAVVQLVWRGRSWRRRPINCHVPFPHHPFSSAVR
jgi:hypothetical protein